MWRPFGRRSLPTTLELQECPTYCDGQVFNHPHHALLDLSFRLNGGVNGKLVWKVYPHGRHAFPAFLLSSPLPLELHAASHAADVVTTGGDLAVHPVITEPTPAALAGIASALLGTPDNVKGCLVVVGSLESSGEPKPVRAILLYRDRLMVASVPPPVEAVEHGWYLCTRTGILCLAFHGQDQGGRLVSPLSPPKLAKIGYCIWRKGTQNTFAIVSRQEVLRDKMIQEWDAAIFRFMQPQERGVKPSHAQHPVECTHPHCCPGPPIEP